MSATVEARVKIENPVSANNVYVSSRESYLQAVITELYGSLNECVSQINDLATKIVALENKQMADINTLNGLINGKQDKMIKGGYTGSMDNLKTEGWYWCNFSEVAGSPYTSGYAVVEVLRPTTGQTFIQRAMRFNANVGVQETAIRIYTNSQWYAWRKTVTVTF